MLMTSNRRLREVVGVLETGNVLFLRLLLQRNAGAKSYLGSTFREYMKVAEKGPWSCKPLFDIFPELVTSRPRIVVEHSSDPHLATPLVELAIMALVTQAVQPSRVFEIGTYRGRTALNFALNSPPECQVFTLDLPDTLAEDAARQLVSADKALVENRLPTREYEGSDVAPKITQLLGDSTRFDFSPYHGQMDLVFVDGGHTYDVASSDTRAALQMCKSGGVILWHDWGNYGDYFDVMSAVLDQLSGREVIEIENTQLAVYRKP